MKKRILFSLLPFIILAVISTVLAGSITYYIGAMVTSAPPSGWTQNSNPTDPFVHNNFSGAVLHDITYGSIGNGTLVFSGSTTTTNNLSSSQGTLTLTGSGTVLGLGASGTYSFSNTDSLTNSEPVYIQTGGSLNAWYTGSSGTPALLNTWVVTGSASLGTSTSSSLAASTGVLGLDGQQFLTSSGSAVSYSGTGALTGALSGAYSPSGASQPCSVLQLTCTSSGCLLGSTSSNVTYPLIANIPTQFPVNNVNTLWISGGSANSVRYFWCR